jgi:GNAT superfamily N-acetyltransferase
MKLLLDTNIIISLDPKDLRAVEEGSAAAARLHQLALLGGHALFVHPYMSVDFGRDADVPRREFRELQLAKYPPLANPPAISATISSKIGEAPSGSNDWVDHSLLAALVADAIDVIVTNDQRIHRKARRLAVGDRVLILEQAVRLLAEAVDEVNPAPPAVESVKAYELEPTDPIFESFRRDYGSVFDPWLQKCRRQHRQSWIIRAHSTGQLDAIAIVNPEKFPPPPATGQTLKLCTFKVADHAHGLRYGELLLGVVFEYALHNEYEHIYVTAFDRQEALIDLLEDFGFERTPHPTAIGEVDLPRKSGRVRDKDYAASCNCASYSAGLT